MQERRYLNSASEAAEQLKQWHAQSPDIKVLALVAEASKSLVAELQKQARDIDIALYGGIFPELVVDGRFRSEGVLLFSMKHCSAAALLPCEKSDVDADMLFNILSPNLSAEGGETLFLMLDSMVPHIASMLDDLYLKFADRVNYVGINAGSETFQPMPCLFNEESIMGQGVLALLLHKHAGSLLNHGYVISESSSHSATTTEGNRIVQIDWRPAFDVYRELVMNRFGQEITAENFYQYGVHFPFGLLRANGEVMVRIPVALTEDGSLFCVGEVPPNSMVTVLDAEQKLLSDAVSELGKSVAACGWSMPLTFYCAGRRMHLGVEAAEREIALLAEHVGKVDGALSLGEIGNMREGDCPLFHNATLICCEWDTA